jgi:hypothetical protein
MGLSRLFRGVRVCSDVDTVCALVPVDFTKVFNDAAEARKVRADELAAYNMLIAESEKRYKEKMKRLQDSCPHDFQSHVGYSKEDVCRACDYAKPESGRYR